MLLTLAACTATLEVDPVFPEECIKVLSAAVCSLNPNAVGATMTTCITEHAVMVCRLQQQQAHRRSAQQDYKAHLVGRLPSCLGCQHANRAVVAAIQRQRNIRHVAHAHALPMQQPTAMQHTV
jgi:hypothetical protein